MKKCTTEVKRERLAFFGSFRLKMTTAATSKRKANMYSHLYELPKSKMSATIDHMVVVRFEMLRSVAPLSLTKKGVSIHTATLRTAKAR